MKKIILFSVMAACLCVFSAYNVKSKEWVSLFDGKSLKGWKVGENAKTFSVQNGEIVVHGETAHLFYEGDYMKHDFKNFEFRAQVMNSGHRS
jgi:hypothetical protein